jgi:hypothetical protein
MTEFLLLTSFLGKALKAIENIMCCPGLDSEFLHPHGDAFLKRLFRFQKVNEKRSNVWIVAHINERFITVKCFLLLPKKVFQDLALAVTGTLALSIHEESP